MEFLSVYIKNEKFKIPITHQRLKHLISNKFKLDSDSEIEKDICLLYSIRKTDSDLFDTKSNKINIFLLNFYIGLIKREQEILLPKLPIKADENGLIEEINKLLQAKCNFEKIIDLMNNPIKINSLKSTVQNQNIQVEEISVKEQSSSGKKRFSIEDLKQKQNKINNKE